MKRQKNPQFRFGKRCPPVLALAIALLAPAFGRAQIKVKVDTLPDSIEHWYVTEPNQEQSFATQKLKEIFGIVFNGSGSHPFGKSIAFLAGVSTYHDASLPELPSALKDVNDMREFLLRDGGFDEVYVAKNDAVNRDTIEKYMKEAISGRMQQNDRLLFYYSGHGADNHGKTGYMLFGNALKGQFWGPQVLAIDALSDWSRELPIRHILFILDSCASGLGITLKSSPGNSERLLIETLSGNGSRTVLTAGTAGEATYAVEGNGVFTRAFLNAFASRSLSEHDQGSGFITITDIYSDLQKEMAKFRVTYGKATTPQFWTLQEAEYKGTFVFLNPKPGSPRLTEEQARALGAMPRPKSDAERPAEGSGVIQVSSANSGDLYLDDQPVGYLMGGLTRQLLQQPSGPHQIRLQFPARTSEAEVRIQKEVKDITVEAGKITYTTFGLKSPIDDSGSVPVGTLIVQSHELDGEVFIDGFSVGQFAKGAQLTIAHLRVGSHEYKIVGLKQSESGTVTIEPNQTKYTVFRPPPPTNIRATAN
ncbi:MAG TPA: caspase family protein [Candidatus Acidoferrum sp.]|nr:caspase family protein [Candidatus Acidoferrum sp.]